MIALGDVSVTGKEITVTHTRYAFVKITGKHRLVAMTTADYKYIKPG